jgi:hypothetical protein
MAPVNVPQYYGAGQGADYFEEHEITVIEQSPQEQVALMSQPIANQSLRYQAIGQYQADQEGQQIRKSDQVGAICKAELHTPAQKEKPT